MKTQLQHEEQRFRIDVGIHDLLTNGKRIALAPSREPLALPEPVFPQFPQKMGDVEPDARYLPKNGNPYRTRITTQMIRKGLRGWLYPYVRSRVIPGEFHPIIAYVFTEWKCNLDCHYCWATASRRFN